MTSLSFTTVFSITSLVLGFVAGHQSQIRAMVAAAEEMGPDAAALLAQLRTRLTGFHGLVTGQ